MRQGLWLVASVLVLTPATALGQDCSGDPGFALAAPSTASIGETFDICLEAPAGFLATLLISRTEGPLDSPFGLLCVGAPFEGVVPLQIPAGGRLCYPCVVPCEERLIGLQFFGQFVAINPRNPLEGGRSNQVTTTIVDGICDDTFCSFTQGGWGQSCHGHNVGCLRDAHFDSVFPAGLILGDQDGPDGDALFSLVLPSSASVERFLPQGGKPMALSEDSVAPTTTAAGVFAGQLAAAKINVGFDDAGVLDALRGGPGFPLGDLVFTGCVDESLIGLSVRQVIALGDLEISGSPTGVAPSKLSEALDLVNKQFGDCGASDDCLGLP